MLSGRAVKLIALPLLLSVLAFVVYFRESIILAVRLRTSTPLTLSQTPTGKDNLGQEAIEDQIFNHLYRADGLLAVHPNGTHPIYEIIELSEASWRAKLRRASKTLDDAVAEYWRRYKRAPPKGFDAWWSYVMEHNVQLPDEYDQIFRDIEPFWGINPLDLQQLQAQQENLGFLFILNKNDNDKTQIIPQQKIEPSALDRNGFPRGAQDLVSLLERIEHILPPFRVAVSPLDNPNLSSDYAVKKGALDAASRKHYTDLDQLPPREQLGWISACAPSAPARTDANQLANQSLSQAAKTFIYDHRKTMDPCLHPQLLSIHGQFLAHGQGPSPQQTLVPQFSYCATTLHHDIRIPTLLSWVEDTLPRADDPEWDGKLDERLTWRGSNTGIWHAPEMPWRQAQRARLVDLGNARDGSTRVLIPPLSRVDRVGEGIDISKSKLNPALLDMAFAGSPLACPPDYCAQLAEVYEWRRRRNSKRVGQFKYIMDVDGNGWSSRFKRLITSNSLVFKATIYPEWFTERIQPWVHYVPVQVDYSDLSDALLFFRGGLYGEGANEDLARKIASAGREWSKSFWRKEDMTAYLFRLLLEYTRVMSVDRDAMSYDAEL